MKYNIVASVIMLATYISMFDNTFFAGSQNTSYL